MEQDGLVLQDDISGKYKIGPVLLRLAVAITDEFDLSSAARRTLHETAKRSGETAILALHVPLRHQYRAIDAAESDHPIRYIPNGIGEWGDLHVGASGKGILAFLGSAEREAYLQRLADPVPVLGITKAELQRQLDEARRVGYAISKREKSEAVGAAAPIFDGAAHVIGDVIITWPEYRNSPEKEAEMGRIAQQGAGEISHVMGFRKNSRPDA